MAGRLSKLLARYLTVSWREQPTHGEIEALEANVERVRIVIRTRWAIVGVLSVFSVFAVGIYAASGYTADLAKHMIIPGLALALVLVYNGYYQANYRRFGNLAVFNVFQLLADIVVVTTLIYYSGGVYSWFHAMYLLFVLEAAMILPTAVGVWAIAAAAMVAYGGVLGLEYAGVIPHMPMPFVDGSLATQGPYVAVRALWTFTVIAGAAQIGTTLMGEVHRREERLLEQSVRDRTTGLYNRGHLRQELSAEVCRADRYGRGVSVVLADIDDFERFNRTFGHEAGNAMIVLIADAITGVCAGESGGVPEGGPILAARYGGEEFAVLVAEDKAGSAARGRAVAECVRSRVAGIRSEDRSVTVSIGVAAFPSDGRTSGELIAAADAALSVAVSAGGNRAESAKGASGARGART